MSKKKNDRKKINIKLLSGQTYLILSVDQMFKLSNALVHLATSTKNEKDKLEILNLNKLTIEAIDKNQFTGGSFDEEDWV